MSLVLNKLENETWLDAALRHAAKYGLESEISEIYFARVANGTEPQNAAWEACYEWDVLIFRND